MRQEDNIKDKVGKRTPYKVPEGYFDSFRSNLMNSLPEYPEKPKVVKLSRWQRIKPYVYLAAMFAGIWCMMQIFHHVSTAEQNKEERMLAFAETELYYDDMYLDSYSGEDLELQDEVTDLYPSIEDFKQDFYKL